MPGLREMIAAELARREEAGANYNPFTFIVDDDPKALTDVAAAVKAIEEELQARDNHMARTTPRIAPGIEDDVEAELQARHPRRFSRPGISIIAHTIVSSGMRYAALPVIKEDVGPSSVAGRLDDDKAPAEEVREREGDAVEKAAKRIAALRGQF
jgi:hypothetical protein